MEIRHERKIRTSETINISGHFDQCESIEMNMSDLHEVSFVVEGYQNSGSVNFRTLDMIVNKAPAHLLKK